MEKFDFDRESFDRLKQAGWSAKQTVDTTLYLLDWQKYGYSVFLKALKFVPSFGGIRLFIARKNWVRTSLLVSSLKIE